MHAQLLGVQEHADCSARGEEEATDPIHTTMFCSCQVLLHALVATTTYLALASGGTVVHVFCRRGVLCGVTAHRRMQASQLSFGQMIDRETQRESSSRRWCMLCTVLNISNLFSSSTTVLCASVSFGPWCCNCSGQELMLQLRASACSELYVHAVCVRSIL